MAAEEFSVMRFCFALTVTTTCRVLVSRKNRMCDLIVGQGPEGRRLNVSPALPGWADVWMMIPSAVGAAPYRSATRPNFALLGRGTSLSNEINATESTNQLIWTALPEQAQDASPISANLFRLFFITTPTRTVVAPREPG
jgi:hypothetical protein